MIEKSVCLNDREEYEKHMKVHETQNESNGDKRKSNEINKQKYIFDLPRNKKITSV